MKEAEPFLCLDPRRSICRKSPRGKKKMNCVAAGLRPAGTGQSPVPTQATRFGPRSTKWCRIGGAKGRGCWGGRGRGKAPSPHRLRASARAQRNGVGSGGQSGGYLGGVAGGNDHVVVFTGPKTTENRGRLLRLDQRQVSQEVKDVFGGLQPRRDEADFDIFVVEVPSERGYQAHRSLIHHGRQDSGCRVVKYNAELAFIFAAELAHFERAGAGRGFPVHMSG